MKPGVKVKIYIVFFFLTASACQSAVDQKTSDQTRVEKKGEFGYDLQFLKKQLNAVYPAT